jgi:tetratricopeptide (TPR) repeat protein
VDAAKTLVLDYLETAERIGNSAFRGSAHARLGEVLVLAEEWDGAVEACETAVQEFQNVNLPMWLSRSLANLSQALLGRGDLDDARRSAERIVSISEDVPEVFMAHLEARIAQARVLLHAGEFESDVDRLLDEAAELIERSDSNLMAPLISIERAELARRRGQPDQRERYLGEARELYCAMGSTRPADRSSG